MRGGCGFLFTTLHDKRKEIFDGQFIGREGEGAEALTPRLRDALAELHRYTVDRNVIYWWRRASMAKLAELGLAETYHPASLPSRAKVLPYRITEAGRRALESRHD